MVTSRDCVPLWDPSNTGGYRDGAQGIRKENGKAGAAGVSRSDDLELRGRS